MSYSTILEEVKKLSLEERLTLLEAISRLLREELIPAGSSSLALTASEMRRLPMAERQRILAQSARLAIEDYQPGRELVEFTEALAGDDIYDYEAK